MQHYVGWAPTIVGRVAFSRVGSDLQAHPDICNHASRPDGFVFGRETRTSPDGPLPVPVMRLLGRQPDQQFAIFLEVQPRSLPRPCESGTAAVELVSDERGMLSGYLYFFSKSRLSKALGVDAKLTAIGTFARRARSPRTSEDERRALFEQAQRSSAELFASLTDGCLRGQKTPAFARCMVQLDRTGRCDITLGPDDLFIDRQTKLAHVAGPNSPVWEAAATAFEKAGQFISRHAYNVVRDLSHKHYHHHRHADLLATTYPWTPETDQNWRRETLYGLTRMAIDIRRRGSAKAFKQCAGVVAYAEAFQLHLGSWSLNADNTIGPAPTVPPYDFAALRSSIDASLKVRELEDAERRQTILYLTTIGLAALALVVAGVRATTPPPETTFSYALDWMTAHPILTIWFALVAAWFVDLAFLRAALPLPWSRPFYYGLKRAAAALMGSLIWRGAPSWLSFGITLFVLFLVVAAWAGVSALTFYFAYRSITVPPA